MEKDNEDITNDYIKPRMVRTRKAFDWLCACIIRLPIVAISIAITMGIVFFIAYMVAPDVAIDFLCMIGIRV